MTPTRSRLGLIIFAGIWLVGGVGLGLVPQTSATDVGPFAAEPLTCGSPWFPNYTDVTAEAVAQCHAQTLPSAILAAVFILIGALSLLPLIADRPASARPA